jgi:hypothetical protein
MWCIESPAQVVADRYAPREFHLCAGDAYVAGIHD